MNNHIPTYARFQWLNHPLLRKTLAPFFRYRGKGRRGYDKVSMFLWLAYKQLMGCSYRDLESITGIDHTTFIKFRTRLAARLPRLFSSLVSRTLQNITSLNLILDSSFVETYSGHDETGSGYSGYKEANGFKLHQMIDYKSRVPIFQSVSAGQVADITAGQALVSRAPPHLPVESVSADKGYDSEYFVKSIVEKWRAEVAIPMRRLQFDGNRHNRAVRGAHRSRDPALYRRRTEIERYFSRKKRVFSLGEEKTRHLKNFRTNCYFVSCLELLERLSARAV